MPLDPAVADVIKLMQDMDQPPLTELTPDQVRQASSAMRALLPPGAEVASSEDREVGGVPARIQKPHGAGPMPVLVWLHGGGFVIGSAADADALTRDLAAKAGCIVVSVDYRLAPEHKAPAPFEDCLAAAHWVLGHADELGGDLDHVAVGGDSAGGSLAALVTQQLKGRFVAQVLVYPTTDLTMSARSVEENGEGYLLTKEDMAWFRGHYLDGSGIEPDDPRVSPLFADDLVGLPEALVITAEYDPLRDEAEAYAHKLDAHGVHATTRRFDGTIHGFVSFGAAIPAAAEAIDEVAEFLRHRFTR
jgi:acetyl esterase